MQFSFVSIAALVGSAAAHMAINYPCPRYSPNCATKPPLPDYVGSYDVNIKNPISSLKSGETMPLCKYNQAWPQPVASWTAGQPVTVTFQPDGAAHSGGHCQFSMSYDGGKTFAVIHEELEHCFFNGPASGNQAQVLQYTFNLPQTLPASKSAIFSWSWVNASGNREFYMNCADVAISGSSSSYTGKKMTIANYPGYPTIPEFGGNSKTGLEYYTNQPSVTVTGNGGSAPAPPAAPKQVPSQPAVPQPPATSSAEPTSTSVPPVVKPPTIPVPPAVKPPTISVPPVIRLPTIPQLPTSSAAAVPTLAPPSVPIPPPVPAPVSSAPALPQLPIPTLPIPTPGAPGECTHGVYQCTAGGVGFRVCVWGKWTVDISCAAGTACKQASATTVFCGWP